jgi:hypothetical protein
MWDVVYFKKLPWHSSEWDKGNQEIIQSSILYASKNLWANWGTSKGCSAVSILTNKSLAWALKTLNIRGQFGKDRHKYE